MTPAALLADLQARGVRLYLAGDELRYKAKLGVMTPDLAAAIKPHKPTLIAHLQEEEVAISWRAAAMREQIPAAGPAPGCPMQRNATGNGATTAAAEW
ncbi:MAG: hypothetical protein M3R02_19045 [Chloroflexota bacterium]|nr:hypothetical protein [Chloroflexota bacterium]